jgi:hypothetical protein
MQTASQIIDMFDGPSKLASEGGFPLTTVIGWRDANFIPDWRRDALIALGKKRSNKVILTEADFPPVEARISRKDRAA